MSVRGKKFVREFVIGFGFLGGIFLAIGIDPEGEIIKNIINLFAQNNPDFADRSADIFKFISMMILIGTLFAAYKLARIIGFISIFIAFIGGFFIIYHFLTGILLLIIGLMIGLIAPRYKYKI